MNAPKPDLEPDSALAQLADALRDLCDSLVEASLVLRDFRFDHDLTERDKAACETLHIIDRAKSSDNPSPPDDPG